ncbi:MAG: 2Fe-2S iron-sulfur cluster-binding protein [Desulfobacterales bacterium]
MKPPSLQKNTTIQIVVDGRPYPAELGMTVLEVLKSHGYDIPTLCFHPALKPSGSCKLCAVEVAAKSGKAITMLSCILPVKNGLEIKTRGELVTQARVRAFGNLIQMAPQSQKIRDLAKKHGVDLGPPPDGCIRCRLCIRVCKEIVGPGALKMEKREGTSFVVPIPDACIGCGTCVNICPTQVIHIEDQNNVRTISIRNEIIGRHPLETCEGCGKYFATPKFLKHIADRTAPHPDVKLHHRYCPTCAKLFSDRLKPFIKRKEQLIIH